MTNTHRRETLPQLIGFLSLELFVQLCLRLCKIQKLVPILSKLFGCTLDQLHKTIHLVLEWGRASICVF